MAAWDDDIQQSPLYPMVVGALRSAIDAHGPITAEHIGSAAKRIVGQLHAATKVIDERGGA